MRYTYRIANKQVYLFCDGGKWFIEKLMQGIGMIKFYLLVAGMRFFNFFLIFNNKFEKNIKALKKHVQSLV